MHLLRYDSILSFLCGENNITLHQQKYQILFFPIKFYNSYCNKYSMNKKEIQGQAIKLMKSLQYSKFSQELSAFQQNGGTCYAHASSSILIQTESRIWGRPLEDHYELACKLIKKYGQDGANTFKVLEEQCPKKQLRCKIVDQKEALRIIKEDARSLVASFWFSEYDWDHSWTEQINNQGHIWRAIPEGSQGHSVVIVGVDQYGWIFKNSWGKSWGKEGFSRINFGTVKLQLIDVYFIVEDLTQQDKLRFEKRRKGQTVIPNYLTKKDISSMLQLGAKAVKCDQYQNLLTPAQKLLVQKYLK